MTSIYCVLCNEMICKYEQDWEDSGGISVQVGEDLVPKDICHDCAKQIAEEVLEEF